MIECERCCIEKAEDEFVGDICAVCDESLRQSYLEMRAKLPRQIALCPRCHEEFYYPLREGERATCPTPECNLLEMVVYERVDIQ